LERQNANRHDANPHPDHKKIAASDVDRQNRRKRGKKTRIWIKHLPVRAFNQKPAGSKRRKTKTCAQENADDGHWQKPKPERHQVVVFFWLRPRLLAAVYSEKQSGRLRLERTNTNQDSVGDKSGTAQKINSNDLHFQNHRVRRDFGLLQV